MGRKNRTDKTDQDDESVDGDDSVSTQTPTNKPKGLNYAAIALMLMFGLPVLLALVVQSIDFFYPEAANERKVVARVSRCYEAANPSKVAEVEKFVAKYKGRENALFAQLRNKYAKFPECH